MEGMKKNYSKTISQESLDRIEEKLPGILEQDPTMNRLEIAIKLGFRCRQSVFIASQLNPNIKVMLDDYDKEREPNLNDVIRRSWEKRLISGKAQGVEYLFYMQNKFPEEYKDKRALIGTINNVSQVSVSNENNFINQLGDRDLDSFCDNIIQRRQKASS